MSFSNFLAKPRFHQTRVVLSADLYDGDDEGYVYYPQSRFWQVLKPFDYKWMYISDVDYSTRDEAEQKAKDCIRAVDVGGCFVGTFIEGSVPKWKQMWNAFIEKIKLPLRGPKGDQGIPGHPGPMGMMGPAYDDLECPHCRTRRSRTGVYLLMEVEVGGVFSYRCAKCEEKSLWKPINGLWVWQGHTQ